MAELDPLNQWDTLSKAVAANSIVGFSSRQIRPIEYFGAEAVDFGDTPSDNMSSFTDAIEWCSNTGGAVIIGGGVYGVDGTMEMTPFTTLWGSAKWNSVVQQLSATANIDTFTSPSDGDGGTAYCHLRDFQINGGWTTAWGQTAETGAAIRLTTPSNGPSHAILVDRTGSTQSDPHNTIEGMLIRQHPGSGIVTEGRGENQIHKNEIARCLGYGIECGAPDDWWSNNTIYTTGNSGMIITGGNQRIENHKHWFNGMMTGSEGIAAGYEIDGAGISNVSFSNCHAQDTWGPGLVAEGDSPLWLGGSIDEAGGGRLEQQGFGWQGSRTEVRSNIRVNDCNNSEIKVNISGGDRNGAGNRPHLVDFDSSAARNNYIDTLVDEDAALDSALVRTVAGFTNNKRWSQVKMNGRIVFGKVSLANIQDAAHGVNDVDSPDVVRLDGTEDGYVAYKQDDGDWSVATPDNTYTPA